MRVHSPNAANTKPKLKPGLESENMLDNRIFLWLKFVGNKSGGGAGGEGGGWGRVGAGGEGGGWGRVGGEKEGGGGGGRGGGGGVQADSRQSQWGINQPEEMAPFTIRSHRRGLNLYLYLYLFVYLKLHLKNILFHFCLASHEWDEAFISGFPYLFQVFLYFS